MTILSYKGITPRIHEQALISPLAVVLGDVEILEGSSVFPGAMIRGDVARITVGRYSNIQEHAVLHGGDLYDGDELKGHLQVEIGDYVTVAHGAVVHGSKVEDVSMIGINATVFEGSTIGEGSVVGMNAAVLERSSIPKRSIAVGVPVRVVKTVDDQDYSRIKRHAIWYHELAESHRGTLF
jgi:carbonic anhydrase/acetyltransferase-like protein (isoleucine patch superfamily)